MGQTNQIVNTTITATGNEAGGHAVIGEFVGIQINATAVSGTTPSATFSLEWSNDGVTYSPSSPADTFAAITAVGSVVQQFTAKAAYFRLAWSLSGTTPSFTIIITDFV